MVGGYLPGRSDHFEWLLPALQEALPQLGKRLLAPWPRVCASWRSPTSRSSPEASWLLFRWPLPLIRWTARVSASSTSSPCRPFHRRASSPTPDRRSTTNGHARRPCWQLAIRSRCRKASSLSQTRRKKRRRLPHGSKIVPPYCAASTQPSPRSRHSFRVRTSPLRVSRPVCVRPSAVFSLTLAGGEVLTMGSVVYELDIRGARLAVLSACEAAAIDLDSLRRKRLGSRQRSSKGVPRASSPHCGRSGTRQPKT